MHRNAPSQCRLIAGQEAQALHPAPARAAGVGPAAAPDEADPSRLQSRRGGARVRRGRAKVDGRRDRDITRREGAGRRGV